MEVVRSGRSGQIWIYSEGGANGFAKGLDMECERKIGMKDD